MISHWLILMRCANIPQIPHATCLDLDLMFSNHSITALSLVINMLTDCNVFVYFLGTWNLKVITPLPPPMRMSKLLANLSCITYQSRQDSLLNFYQLLFSSPLLPLLHLKWSTCFNFDYLWQHFKIGHWPRNGGTTTDELCLCSVTPTCKIKLF